jgi:hypothetical protein
MRGLTSFAEKREYAMTTSQRRVTAVQDAWRAGLPLLRPTQVTDVEWDVLTRHVSDQEPYIQIARRYGTSGERIRQIAVSATRRLQQYPPLAATELADLPDPVARLLLRAGYRTRADVARAGDRDLLSLPNLGVQRLAEVRACIPHVRADRVLLDEPATRPARAPEQLDHRLTLLPDERARLVAAREAAATARERDRYAAMLHIADGRPLAWIAAQGLSQPRHHAVIHGWLRAYVRGGLAALLGTITGPLGNTSAVKTDR